MYLFISKTSQNSDQLFAEVFIKILIIGKHLYRPVREVLMKPLFYRIEEIAALLHVSKQTLYNHINHNKKSADRYPIPPYIRINGRLLFSVSEFEAWVKAQPRN